jgi:GNAT superfamily N-acetyltransferase
MSALDVIPVESSSDLKRFIAFPNRLYKNDPNYVTPLLMERKQFFDFKSNPFYRVAKVKLFLAVENGRVRGRIATCVNYSHNSFHEEKTGFFGFFDCEDDYDVAHRLFKVAMITLKKEGMERMRGPMNFSTNHEVGFLVEGFDSPPVLMMTYNQPYIPKLAEKFGLRKAMDLLAFDSGDNYQIPERFIKVTDRQIERAGLSIRSLNMSKFDDDVRLIHKVYRQAWEHNWGFVPMEEDEFFHQAKDLKQVVDPNLVIIAEREGEPVGFAMSLPDLNQALVKLNGRLLPFGLFKLLWHTKIRNKVNRCRVITLGVIPEFRKRGIDSVLYVETFRRAVKHGYPGGEASWVLETNEMMRSAMKQMGFTEYKRYRIVEMPI